LLAVAVILAGSCSLFGLDTYDIRVDNQQSAPIAVYYRSAGDGDDAWELLTSVLGNSEGYESPDGGTYEFRVVGADDTVADPAVLYGDAEETLDYQYDGEGDGGSYDYTIYVDVDGIRII
jgi:hypothetical protein